MSNIVRKIWRVTGILGLVFTTACAQGPADVAASRRTAGAVATGGVVIDGDQPAAEQDCARRSAGAVQGGGVVIDRGCAWR